MNILGVRIDNFSKLEVLNKVSEFLNPGFSASLADSPGKSQQYKIFTPNPEMLVDAQKDEYFKQVLNSGNLNVCDGFGLAMAMWLSPSYQEGVGIRPELMPKGEVADADSKLRQTPPAFGPPPLSKRRIQRYPGIDLMQDICGLAEKENKSVYLLGSGSDDIVKKTVEVLQSKYPELKIVGSEKGPKLQIVNYKLQNDDKNDELLHNIIMSAPDILFVAFGHNKQEKWIYENLKDLPSVKIAMGVGGAFDYISGKVSRAPLFLRQIGLEWLYRLLIQPNRIGRIWKATIIFLYHVIRKH